MQSSESLAKLAPALAKAQAEAGRVAKSGKNTFDRYSYANLEDFTAVVKPILRKHEISMTASVGCIDRLEDRPTKSGGVEHAVCVTLNIHLVHASGEWLHISSAGEGQDRADKAIYKAITGARKYAAAMVLNLATTDDPEATERPDGEPKATPPKTGATDPDPTDPSGYMELADGTVVSVNAVAEPGRSSQCVEAFWAIGVGQEEIEQFLGTDDKPNPLVRWTNGDIERTKPFYVQENEKRKA